MDREPKLPTPQIEPEKVAEAILGAAEKAERDVRVGAMSVMNTIAAKVMPSAADKMSAKQADRQQYDEPPRNPDGTLWQPGVKGWCNGGGGPPAAKLTRPDQPDRPNPSFLSSACSARSLRRRVSTTEAW